MKLSDFLAEDERRKVVPASADEWVAPMLAVLASRPFSDPDWIFERKLDGIRILAHGKGGDVALWTRNRKRRNDHFPEIVKGLSSWAADGDFVVDGEIVCFRHGVTSFSRLQQRAGISDPKAAERSGIAVFFYVFDLINHDGCDIRQLSLRRRKSLLRQAWRFADPIRLTPHRNEAGEACLEAACRKGWEGIIAKQADSTYLSTRSRKWLKLKCVNRQELVVTGFTDPRGERKGFGALQLGYYENGDLVDAGRVGTGFDDQLLVELRRRLESLERQTSPIDRNPPEDDGIHWVRPELVAEIGFTEWTGDGKLRHPRFIGLRHDKDPKDVVREVPR